MPLLRVLKTTLLVALCALTLTASASAHGVYNDSAYNTESNIKRKFPRVGAVLCKPVPAWARSQYKVYSEVRGTVRYWNHFFCGVALKSGGVCLVVAHMTGKQWHQFILTSWPSQGCTPRQLRG